MYTILFNPITGSEVVQKSVNHIPHFYYHITALPNYRIKKASQCEAFLVDPEGLEPSTL